MLTLWQIHLWSRHWRQACDEKTLSGASHEERRLNSCYSLQRERCGGSHLIKYTVMVEVTMLLLEISSKSARSELLYFSVSRLSKRVVSAHLMNRYRCSCCQRIKISSGILFPPVVDVFRCPWDGESLFRLRTCFKIEMHFEKLRMQQLKIYLSVAFNSKTIFDVSIKCRISNYWK